MSNIPQWQVNLLARYPRPLAVLLIACGQWMLNTGLPVLITAVFFLGIPALSAVITQTGIAGMAAAFVFNVLAGIVMYAAWDAYRNLDRKLPRREKKDESA